jgi:hypothetical protein
MSKMPGPLGRTGKGLRLRLLAEPAAWLQENDVVRDVSSIQFVKEGKL